MLGLLSFQVLEFILKFNSKYRLLITFANSLNPDQTRQNVRPDLDPNCLTLRVFLKEFFEIVDFEKNEQTAKKF